MQSVKTRQTLSDSTPEVSGQTPSVVHQKYCWTKLRAPCFPYIVLQSVKTSQTLSNSVSKVSSQTLSNSISEVLLFKLRALCFPYVVGYLVFLVDNNKSRVRSWTLVSTRLQFGRSGHFQLSLAWKHAQTVCNVRVDDNKPNPDLEN